YQTTLPTTRPFLRFLSRQALETQLLGHGTLSFASERTGERRDGASDTIRRKSLHALDKLRRMRSRLGPLSIPQEVQRTAPALAHSGSRATLCPILILSPDSQIAKHHSS